MSNLLASEIKANMLRLAKSGLRSDGRKLEEFRKIELEPNALQKAAGTCRVTMGDTQLMVGVQVTPGTPYPDKPGEGALAVNSELLPLADPHFESGPPRPPSIELSRVVDRGIRESKMIDMTKMVLEPGKHVWMVAVDLWVLDFDGNAIDAAGIGATSALLNSRMPKGKVVDDKVEIVEEHHAKLPVQELPVPCTVGKVGEYLIPDPTAEEEDAMDARLTVTTRKDGSICAMQKGGTGTFTEEEVLRIADISIARGKEVRKLLK